MCGICGIVTVQPDGMKSRETIQRMSESLTHRGPDDFGYYYDDYASFGVRRLAIIDLATGHQPITNENRSIWLIFNGEIYNYQELHHQLVAKGHKFTTHSDSEVILHAYEEYQEQCVDHLLGMFAFAIWDSGQNSLLLARDRIGIKPLYYWCNNQQIAFGSELKALLHHADVPTRIDDKALDLFLSLEYIPGPWTIFEEVKKLLPGHYLVFKNGSTRLEKYWDIPTLTPSSNEQGNVRALLELMQNSVHQHLVSDAPLGVFLSGGIDSSSIVALMSQINGEKIKTFSIGFEDHTYNELPYARAVAAHFHTEHSEEILTPDIGSLFDLLIGSLDEPFGDFSLFPTYLLAKFAGQAVKVVLTGDGGDEIFGGYDTYLAQKISTTYLNRLPGHLRKNIMPAVFERIQPQSAKKGMINKLKRLTEGEKLPDSLRHLRWMIFLDEGAKAQFYSPEFHANLNGNHGFDFVTDLFARASKREPLAQLQYVDIKTYLVDDILTKVDRMSMASSVEARVPLLDHRIVEYCVNLPTSKKIQRGKTKIILRQAMRPYLPQMVIDKPKEGFSVPIKHWLRGPLKPLMLDLLASKRITDHGYFDPATVSRWVKEHLDGKVNHSHRLWSIMVFERWLETKKTLVS